MTIGIPRALIYWKQPLFWETFFEELGCKVLLSPFTNKKIIEMGVKAADPETCFSNKVFWGHLLYLEGKADYIFVPLLKTNEQGLEYCPKFFGLPDLAKILTKTPILSEIFDWKKENTEKTLEKLGKKLKKNKKRIKEANKIALLKGKELKEKIETDFIKKIKSKKSKIVLISHPYNLYDEYLNLRIKEKLKKLGVEPFFIDEVPIEKEGNIIFNNKTQNNDWPKFHWEFGQEIMEKVQQVLNYDITGAIEISSFQCGCDAVLKEFVEKEFKNKKIPFLYLLIDEHTAEAGLQTRLEAFIDTLCR